MAGAPQGGEGEEGDAGLFLQQPPAARRRGFGDVRQLLGIGVRHHAAVAVEQAAAVRQRHEKAGGDHPEAGPRSEASQGCPQGVGGGGESPHHRAVRPSGGDPEHRVIERIEGQGRGLGGIERRQARGEEAGERRKIGIGGGIVHRHGEGDPGRLGDGGHFRRRPHQLCPAEAERRGPLSRDHHPGIGALGEHDDGRARRGGSPGSQTCEGVGRLGHALEL